jgi:hypothetical protein
VLANQNSPYSDTASTYLERGLAVLPCKPGAKFPGRFTAADGWMTAYNWQTYCDRLPTNFETSIWERWPDAGVCLALGRASAPKGMQLIAVDIDTEEPSEVAAIRACLPGSPVRKKGAKGETEFYLAPDSVPNRPYNDATKRRMLDLLGHGRQTVLPPTIHPDLGEPYRWTSLDTLENFDVADLPVLPADIADRLGEALAPFGHVDPPKLGGGSADPDAEASTHRQLNDAALANLSAWVPSLALFRCEQKGGGYRAVAHWRPSSSGRPLSSRAKNLIISADGIRDKGAEEGYTPLDLVMSACEADLDTAFRWLQERVAPVAPIKLTAKVQVEEVEQTAAPEPAPKQGNLASLRLATFMGEPVQPCAANDTDDDCLAEFSLEHEPGLLGDLARWSQIYAYRPVREFAQPAALAVLSALFGRRWATPTGLGLNLYIVAIADTGGGKDALIGAPRALLVAAGFRHLLGPGDFSSDAAIEKSLRSRPSQIMLLDEFGKLAQAMMGRNAPAFAKLAAKALLEIYPRSQPGSEWTGKARASDEHDAAADPIYSPTLSLLGVSTPEGFFDGMSQATLDDGFLNRLTVVRASKAGQRQRDPARLTPPSYLLDALREAHEASQSEGNLAAGASRIAGAAPSIQFAHWADDEAISAIEAVETWEDDLGDQGRRGVAGRAAEQVQKIATLRALARDPGGPLVSAEDVNWAFAMVRASIADIEAGAREMMAGSEFEALVQAVERAVAGAGPEGIKWSYLVRAKGVSKADDRLVDAAVKRLVSAERVWQIGPGGKRLRLRRLDEQMPD